MRIRDSYSRHVRLSLTDFEDDPAALTATLGAPNVKVWRKGDPVAGGRARPRRVSGIWVSFGFDVSVVWDDAFLGLLEIFGGVDSLEQFLLRVGARDQHIHFQIPTRNSPHQENNYLSRTT